MERNPIIPVKTIIFVLMCLCISEVAFSQVMQAGLKIGGNASWVRSDDPNFRRDVTSYPKLGFNGGAVFSFKMKERFFLHTELIYSTKGKINVGTEGLVDNVTYRYIDLPLTYNAYFKGKLSPNSSRVFKWFAGIGPNFSYWLGGNGKLINDLRREYGAGVLNYKIKFGTRTAQDYNNSAFVYYREAKRFQLGVNIGGGILLEPSNGGKIMFDMRFELGHTWLGKANSGDFVDPGYQDNLKGRNMGLRFSVMYMFESNLDKKVRNKGKTTLKKKQR